MKQKEKHTYMLVWNNPLCCDKFYEIVFCTPMKTWPVLLNGEGKILMLLLFFLFIHFVCITMPW